MSKNWPLIIGIALPAILIAVVSFFVFMPARSIKPEHNFLYTLGDYSYDRVYKNAYGIDNGKLILKPLNLNIGANARAIVEDAPTLYLYDVKNSSAHEIKLTDAQKLALDPGPSSPDGYTVEYKYNDEGIFGVFGSNNNDSGLVVSKGGASKKLLSLTNNNNSYRGDFKLVGWVK